MTDPDTPTTEKPVPSRPNALTSLLSQANITTGLAIAAVILAAAPYVVPQIQTWQVRNGLMAKPAVLEEAVSALQREKSLDAAQTAVEAIKAHHDKIFNDASDPVIGNPNGKVQVAEFLDYLCAYCRAATPQVKDFLAANPDVKLIIKEYPVVHPPDSVGLAHLGVAAFQSGHYEPMHYALLNGTIKTAADLDTFLKEQGMDPKAINAVANAQATSDKVAATINLGSELGINGTPTFIVGDQMINGADINALQTAVAAARKAG